MKLVVYGAGAIGGLAGALMADAGEDVVLIARGAHAEAIQKDGLTIASANGEREIPVTTVTDPASAGVEPGDAVLLAVKSHQTEAALDALTATAPPGINIACLQNGVANERTALRRFNNVYAVCVMCPAGHLEPGVVRQDSVPIPGLFDIGRYPEGTDATTARLSEAFRKGGFDSIERPDVMRWKYRKLIMNVGNAVEALCAPDDKGRHALSQRAREEGEMCFRAAGIDFASSDEDRRRRADLLQIREIPGRPRGGGSSWQSLQRGTGNIESDYLNGEVSLLGRLHGVPTPVNDLLRDLARRAARNGEPPGQHSAAELEKRLLAETEKPVS
jgi:2-dehydropantoate 2-reductase